MQQTEKAYRSGNPLFCAEIAVLTDIDNGDAKLAYAEKFLKEHKIKLDMDTLKAMIDAEIKKMEQAEHKEEPPMVPEVSD